MRVKAKTGFVVIVLFGQCLISTAQFLKGKVISADTGEGLGYASVDSRGAFRKQGRFNIFTAGVFSGCSTAR